VFTPEKRELGRDCLSERQRDVVETLVEQLGLLGERNESAQAYLRALQNQISTTLSSSLDAIDSQKAQIISELDNYVKEERTFLLATAASKQEVLTSLCDQCASYADQVKSAIIELESLHKAPNGYSEALDLAEAVAALPSPEPDYPYAWAQVAEPQFRFVLHRKHAKDRRSKPRKSKKEVVISDLTKAYKELETRYKQVQSPGPLPTEPDRLKGLETLNKGLDQRLS
jgi:hypothetical protein